MASAAVGSSLASAMNIPSPYLFQPQVANHWISIDRDSHAPWYKMGSLILTCSEGRQKAAVETHLESRRGLEQPGRDA